MNTPITDAAVESITLDCDDSCLPIYVYKHRQEYEGGVVDAGTSQLLELDRAALMEALEECRKLLEFLPLEYVHKDRYQPIKYSPDGALAMAQAALSTARSNFP